MMPIEWFYLILPSQESDKKETSSVFSAGSSEAGERLKTEAGTTEDRTPETESLLPNEKEMSAFVCGKKMLSAKNG
jgi:hypothetical protein